MAKVKDDLLLEIVDKLDRGENAINNLERLGSNKIVYLELKKEMQDLSERIKTQFALREYSDESLRDRQLEINKRASGQ